MPCNNDLLAGNFVEDDRQVWLIDYEYSGNNDACFELGNTSTECDLDDDQVAALVEAYAGSLDTRMLARVRLQALVSAYGWALWGAIQSAASDLDFDFDVWSREHFEKAARGFTRGRVRTRCCGRSRVADLPDRARVVVVGGGVIGTSMAYHLAHLGWTDVLLLEQGTLSCGTTWHAAGLVGQLRASESGTRLVQYSGELYARLEEETGLSTGYKQCGGLIVARTPERMTQLRRTAANADAYGLECEMLSPDEALGRWPLMRVDDLLGAIWLPGDGTANPTDLTTALAKGARQRGVRGARAHPGHSTCSSATARSPACAPTAATSRPRWS